MPAARACAVAASVMNLTAVLVTRFGNVPLNQLVRKWLTEPPPVGYLGLLHRWTVFNNIRSAGAVLGFALILIADALLDLARDPLTNEPRAGICRPKSGGSRATWVNVPNGSFQEGHYEHEWK
jgi:hypothetical protein